MAKFRIHIAQNKIVQLRGATIGPYFHVVSRFDLAPLQGASLRGWSVPRVETLGLSSVAPSGHSLSGPALVSLTQNF